MLGFVKIMGQIVFYWVVSFEFEFFFLFFFLDIFLSQNLGGPVS